MKIEKITEYRVMHATALGEYRCTASISGYSGNKELFFTKNGAGKLLPMTPDNVPSMNDLENRVYVQMQFRPAQETPRLRDLPSLSEIGLYDKKEDPVETEAYSIVEAILQRHLSGE